MINRQKFFDGYREQFGKLKQGQVDGLNFLLGAIESDPFMKDIRWAAYALTTTKHETANTFKPIHEYGSHEYFVKRYGSQTKVGKILGNDTPEEGADYAGRGDVQLTGENNYEAAEVALRKQYPQQVKDFEARTGQVFDLSNDGPGSPDQACDPILAYCIMSYGMRSGMFTGVGLKRYINDQKCDYLNARRIINGLDCAKKIADEAIKFQTILEASWNK